MVANLASLKKKKGLDIDVHYTSKGPGAFAKDAARNGPNSISIFFGHGYSTRTDRRVTTAHPDTIKEVERALGRKIVVDVGVPPRVAFFSCFAGQYNNAVNEAIRLPKPYGTLETVKTGEYAEHFNQAFKEYEKLIDDTIKETKRNVTLHLYFGDDGKRTQVIKQQEEKGRNRLFEKW